MLLDLPTFVDERGKLTVIDGLPFAVKRAFWVYGSTAERGGHGHFVCEQIMVAVHGTVSANLDGKAFTLDNPAVGLYIMPGTLLRYRLGQDAVCLVLCSEHYDPEDYFDSVQ